MKNIVKNRKKFQDILYYIAGYFIVNEDVPTIQEVADFMGCARQNISQYFEKLKKEGYLIILPNRAIRKYGINLHKLTILREHNVNKKFIEFGLIDDPLEKE